MSSFPIAGAPIASSKVAAPITTPTTTPTTTPSSTPTPTPTTPTTTPSVAIPLVSNEVATSVLARIASAGLLDPTTLGSITSLPFITDPYNAGFSWGSAFQITGMIAQAVAIPGSLGGGILGTLDAANNFKFAATIGIGNLPGCTLSSDAILSWDATATALNGTPDVMLSRIGPGILAQLNGLATQEFRAYQNGNYISLGHSATSSLVGLSLNGSLSGTLSISNTTGGVINLCTAGFTRWTFDASGGLTGIIGNLTLSVGNFLASLGNITATAGNISAPAGIITGNSLVSTTSVLATTSVTGATVVATTSVTAPITITTPVNVAQLPGVTNGARAFVLDSTVALSSTSIATAVVGGGTIYVPVYSDGTSWLIG